MKRSWTIILAVCCIAYGAVADDAVDPSIRIVELFVHGDFQGARLALSQADVRSLDSRARYFAGRLAWLDGEARAHFEAAASDPAGAYADDAAIELAESAYADPRGLYFSARRAFRHFVDTFPQSPHVPLALYRIGRTYLIAPGESSHIDSARASFELILSRFPESIVSRYAASALREIDGKPEDFGIGFQDSASHSDLSLPANTSGDASALLDRPGEVKLTFWVKVGTFSKRSLVDRLVARLQKTELRTRLVDSGKMVVVQVGPYRDRGKAEAVGRHISLVESLQCQVIEE